MASELCAVMRRLRIISSNQEKNISIISLEGICKLTCREKKKLKGAGCRKIPVSARTGVDGSELVGVDSAQETLTRQNTGNIVTLVTCFLASCFWMQTEETQGKDNKVERIGVLPA